MTHTHDKLYKTLTEAWKQLQENTVYPDHEKNTWIVRNDRTGEWLGNDNKWINGDLVTDPNTLRPFSHSQVQKFLNGLPDSDLSGMSIVHAKRRFFSNNVTENMTGNDLSPGTVVVASGYPRNSMSMKPEATAIPKFIGVISDTHEGQNISAYPIKMLSSGGLPDVQGRYQINKGLPVEVADINALGLSPEEIQKANEIIAKFTGKTSQNTEVDPNIGGRLGT